MKKNKEEVKKQLEEARRQNAPMQQKLQQAEKKVKELDQKTRELVTLIEAASGFFGEFLYLLSLLSSLWSCRLISLNNLIRITANHYSPKQYKNLN